MPEPTGTTERTSKPLKKALGIWQTRDKGFPSGLQQQRRGVGVRGGWGAKGGSEEEGGTVYLLGRKLSRKLILPNSVEDIVMTSQKLCEEYIGMSSNFPASRVLLGGKIKMECFAFATKL